MFRSYRLCWDPGKRKLEEDHVLFKIPARHADTTKSMQLSNYIINLFLPLFHVVLHSSVCFVSFVSSVIHRLSYAFRVFGPTPLGPLMQIAAKVAAEPKTMWDVYMSKSDPKLLFVSHFRTPKQKTLPENPWIFPTAGVSRGTSPFDLDLASKQLGAKPQGDDVWGCLCFGGGMPFG